VLKADVEPWAKDILGRAINIVLTILKAKEGHKN